MPDSLSNSTNHFPPAGDQPTAILRSLLRRLSDGLAYQTLLGVIGSGKTTCMANSSPKAADPPSSWRTTNPCRPALCRNARVFPENAVEYFVSYYDYYQPKAYVPSRDLFIEKDSAINNISSRCAFPPPRT